MAWSIARSYRQQLIWVRRYLKRLKENYMPGSYGNYHFVVKMMHKL